MAKPLEEIVGNPGRFLGREELAIAKRIARGSHQREMSVSAGNFVRDVSELLGLSFAAVYVNKLWNMNVEIEDGKVSYDDASRLEKTLLEITSPVLKLDGCARYIVPLEYRGSRFGVSVFENSSFSDTDIALILEVVSSFSQHLNNIAEIPLLRKLVYTDELTCIPNRRKFNEDYEVIKGSQEHFGRKFSIIFADVDKFHEVNNTYGHAYGDYVLKEIAHLLQLNIREGDTVYRYAGEEFVVILPDTSVQDAEDVARRINDAVRRKVFVDDELPKDVSSKIYYESRDSSSMTISMGVADDTSGQGNATDILKLADALLMKAKTYRNAVYSNIPFDSYTGLAGTPKLVEFMEKKLSQCNRSVTPSGIVVFDVAHFRKAVDDWRANGASAWNAFREIAKWLYGENNHFDFVARMSDRDSLIVALSANKGIDEFRQQVSDVASNYLNILRKYSFKVGEENLCFDFAAGAALYDPTPLTDQERIVVAKNPLVLVGFADSVAAQACELESRLKIDTYRPASKR